MIKAVYTQGREPEARSLFFMARETLENARREAATYNVSIRSKLAKKLNQLRKRAFRLGYAAGLRAAEEAVLTSQLNAQRRYEQLISEAHGDCLDLTLSVARSVIADEIALRPETIATRIARGLETLIERRQAVIFLNPEDVQAVQDALEHTLPETQYRLVAEEEVQRGNARIETISGSLELNWQDHLEELSGRLRSKLLASVASAGGNR